VPSLPSGVLDGDFHVDSGFDIDGSDFLYDLAWAVEVNDALVNPHLEPVPGVRALPARRLPDGVAENLRWHLHGSADLQLVVPGPLDQLRAHFLEGLGIPRGQGDPDLVDLGGGRGGLLLHWRNAGHCVNEKK